MCAGEPAGGSTAVPPNFDAMSVHQLKEYLSSRGISHTGLFEKSDLVSGAKQAAR